MIKESDISVAVMYPGNRVDKMLIPLRATDMTVDVSPEKPYNYDIVLLDNADRNMIFPVFKKNFKRAKVVYRMRGDVYRELELWDMHPLKKWIAKNLVLKNVDGAICVNRLLQEKIAINAELEHTGVGSLAINPIKYPKVKHSYPGIRGITLTNLNYIRKTLPLLNYASTVNKYLEEWGGNWRIYGKGKEANILKEGLEYYDNIHFMGYTDTPKDKLKDANVMLHFSELDGMPNAILEGMASNLPVITNDFEAFEYYTGPIQTFSKRDELVCMLDKCTDISYRDYLGRKGMMYVAKYHNKHHVGNQYVKFFRSML